MTEKIIGRNPIIEALKGERTIEKLVLLNTGQGSLKKIEAMAKEQGVFLQWADKNTLDRLSEGGVHQGVMAYISSFQYSEVEDMIQLAKSRGEDPLLILLDGVEDPHNLGAILRTADGAGAHGVIIPKRRSAAINATVAKASAGAVEYVKVAKVSNLTQTIERLKEAGLWIGACDMGGQLYHQTNLKGGLALVIGGEGQGIGRLVKEKCDFVLSMPMNGCVNSLNASNAAAILMYEAIRQRKVSDSCER